MQYIVAIHGVGSPTPGTTIDDLSSGNQHFSSLGYQKGTLVIEGRKYPTLTPEGHQAPTLVEVNWSDVRSASPKVWSVIRHLGHLWLAMLYVGVYWPDTNHSKRFQWSLTRCYAIFLKFVLLGAILLPPYSMLITCLEGGDCFAFLGLFPLGMFLLAYALRAETGLVCATVTWGFLFVLVVILFLLFQESTELRTRCDLTLPMRVIQYSAWIYSFSQIVAGALLLFAALEVLLSSAAGRTSYARLSRLAFLYTPLLWVAVAGPLLMTAAMRLPATKRVMLWGDIFSSALLYNLASGEVYLTICVSVIGMVALLGVLAYWLGSSENRGCNARSWLKVCLIATPIALCLNALALICVPKLERFGISNLHAFDVYRYSALRVLPLIPFCIGPLAVLLGVLGDVAFYLLPDRHWLSTRTETQRRLEKVLTRLIADKRTTKVILVAHSQGTVIATDVVSRINSDIICLITAGSPVESLYTDFLGITVGPGYPKEADSWKNVYRSDDYIGGSISQANNIPWRPDGHTGFGHTGYWSNRKFQELVFGCALPKNDS